jgi:hypothetical protein
MDREWVGMGWDGQRMGGFGMGSKGAWKVGDGMEMEWAGYGIEGDK